MGESDRSVEAVNHLAELTKNEEELAKWSDIAAGVTAKFGDSLPIEGLTEAANHTAKLGEVQGPLADALEWCGISADDFNAMLAECSTEEERATLITETLNKEYQKAADEYNELTASTQDARRATSEMEAAQAELGAAIEPVTTAWTRMKAGGLQWLVDTGLPALKSGFGWVLDNIPFIAALIGTLTTAWLVFGGAQKVTAAVTTVLTAAQTALNVVLNANPIGLVILAVTALVAAFLYLWNNCEVFREFWLNLWDKIKEIAGAVAEWFKQAWADVLAWFESAVAKIKEFFSAAWEGIKEVFSNSIIGDYFEAIWDTIKGVFSVVKAVLSGNWSDAWDGIKGIVSTWEGFFSGVWTKIKSVFSAIGTWFGEKFGVAKDSMLAVFLNIKAKFTEIKDRIFDAFGDIKNKFLEIGDNIVQGIWDGISGAYEWIKGKITGWVGNVTGFLKGLFGIESPSTVMRDEIGEMLPPGIAIGWEKAMPKMEKEMQGDISALTAKMQATVATESAKVGYTYTGQIDGTEDIVRAVGMQTAGINSLANEYRRGSGNTRPIILKVGEREFGRAVVDLGGAEESRVGLSYA